MTSVAAELEAIGQALIIAPTHPWTLIKDW
jgi:hypothetical protein